MTVDVDRGTADGMAGRPMAGESHDYGAAYLYGRKIAEASAGDYILYAGEGARCPRCDTHFFGQVGGCGCREPGPEALERGAYVVYGPASAGVGGIFMTNGDLHKLIATGLRAIDVDGKDVSCEIQRQQ